MAKAEKTNVLRRLETEGISFAVLTYEVDEEHLQGTHAAAVLGLDPDTVYKTLVLCDDKHGHLVCVIPVAQELDLKKVARASGHKAVQKLPVKELLPLTGYIRGGCSPIGMKKAFPTFIQQEAQLLVCMSVSAGMRGMQVQLAPDDLLRITGAAYADLCR